MTVVPAATCSQDLGENSAESEWEAESGGTTETERPAVWIPTSDRGFWDCVFNDGVKVAREIASQQPRRMGVEVNSKCGGLGRQRPSMDGLLRLPGTKRPFELRFIPLLDRQLGRPGWKFNKSFKENSWEFWIQLVEVLEVFRWNFGKIARKFWRNLREIEKTILNDTMKIKETLFEIDVAERKRVMGLRAQSLAPFGEPLLQTPQKKKFLKGYNNSKFI